MCVCVVCSVLCVYGLSDAVCGLLQLKDDSSVTTLTMKLSSQTSQST